jgi:FAD/FMN-containing dehydrogenase
MNKIAQYLNTHMLGEVLTNPRLRASYAFDGSVLTYVPEMIALPAATSDIRKIARFAWQLAEKGHTLPLTVRGAGIDSTGAAIGTGMIIATTPYMNRIFEYDSGQKLVRLQPGVTVNALDNALALHGTAIPELKWDHPQASVGGALASSRGLAECVDQLEVVLANGDVLQTRRINKRELAKKKGQPGFEGDIYRALDNLIDDNAELLDQLAYQDARVDNEGYAGIEQVKNKDGSFDLAPLILGSQGTLGIISEMILKADFVNHSPTVVVAMFKEVTEARDTIDVLHSIDPSRVEYLDSTFFDSAAASGRKLPFYEQAVDELGSVEAVMIITINDFSERARSKKRKKIHAALKKLDVQVIDTEDLNNSDLRALGSIADWQLNPESNDVSLPPLLDGVYIPLDRFEEFVGNLEALAQHEHVQIGLYGRPLDELWFIRPMLKLGTVGGKQSYFKLAAGIASLVEKHDGTPFAAGGEGRIGASVRAETSEISDLYKQVRTIFDPYGSLNPGVKHLRSSYTGPAATHYLTKF